MNTVNSPKSPAPKNQTTSVGRSKSKDKRYSLSVSKLSVDCSNIEDFEDNILDVDITKNRSARNFFISETFENEYKGQKIVDVISELSKKWNSLAEDRKKKYEDLAHADKMRYEDHIALVRKHLISKPLKEKATAFMIYMDEAAKHAIENLQDVKEARLKAREEWKNLSTKDKEAWEEKKNANQELYDRLRQCKPGNVSGYALWVKDQISLAKDKGNTITLTDCAERWPKVKEEMRQKYNEYAHLLKEEKSKQRDLYEITFGIKPRRPLGSFNFYLQEMAKLKTFSGTNFIKECSASWKKLTEEQKEKYERISKRDRLIYVVKKMEFNNYKRTTFKRAPTAFNFYVGEMREKLTGKDLDNKGAFEYISDKWSKESEATKKKYQKMADNAKKDNEQEKDDYLNRVFEVPKRAKSGYQIFLSERLPELKEKNDVPTTELFKMVAEEWNGFGEEKKENYNKKAEPGREAYKNKMREFDRLGFYTMPEEDKVELSAKKSAKKTTKSNSKSPLTKSKKKKD